MSHNKSATGTCQVCGQTFPVRELVAAPIVRDNIAAEIRREHPEWNESASICRTDLARYRAQYVHALLLSEKGELSTLENEVVRSLQNHQTLASDVDSDFDENRSFGERLADRIADFGGSWTFLICLAVFIVAWIAMNSLVLYWRPVDPFPYILLNLLLSCLAAIQAPLIMMSQNRQETKDRERAENDYNVNLKSELIVGDLHMKLDSILDNQDKIRQELDELRGELREKA